ncbi:hypothetical protein PCO86_01740 [Pectobacteriaceae bacterium CE70]|uniref:hypothetical protein n=1 Tax=Pectobacteriaceae TaxID=1903410 RepID=UPI0004200058|nr:MULTISPECIES: hypothetical protein [Enterobacterales]WJV58568.1 hypothetical protein PCO84_01620 [Pectobacteriaceae bacterium C111]WJV62873.1 hypothetical protein PCO87_01705 [Pectobacteriaceae bacterium C52]WJV67211.1 hypothetical protein PCO86_01740 [Pectobacteriaceae bacterium CE70]WJY11193.1 hypothetical protein PCO80_01740 [Pectobacteriaceae bacterium C80]WJY14777.1 hypothetical protein PCO82_20310 [Pectobacteriaceae bacterium CE90]
MKSAYFTNHTQQRQGSNTLCYGEKVYIAQTAMIRETHSMAFLQMAEGIITHFP